MCPRKPKKIIITIFDLLYYNICFIVVSKVCLYDFPLWVWAWPWIFFGQWSVSKPDVSRGLTNTCILGACIFCWVSSWNSKTTLERPCGRELRYPFEIQNQDSRQEASVELFQPCLRYLSHLSWGPDTM